MPNEPLTYGGSGVEYDVMDRFKVAAQEAARGTGSNIDRLQLSEVPSSRGESAFLIDAGTFFIAHVEEGLGTKNLVAETMSRPDPRTELSMDPRFYEGLSQDTVAMIVNDLITVGALPISIAMHLAVGDSNWFYDTGRVDALLAGWARACNLAGAVWAGGETPTLKGIVEPGTMLLSGSAIGIVEPKSRLIDPVNIRDGDAIVMMASSGIHANGLTLARQIGERVGYKTRVGNGHGQMLAEALLEPTAIYVMAMEAILNADIHPHYAVNITGHGWRKLMRAVEPFVYVISTVPVPEPVFEFIQRHGPVTEREMYANYNMGAGFALYLDPSDAEKAIRVSRNHGIFAWQAGHIKKQGETKKVVIEPKGIEYEGSTLAVR